tara:strand:+ start:321 stop:953 length:633 start_codon:yes stop_codon:yes gene_type:complete
MGFGGGGGGAITPHVHNSVPLQGGPLDFANDTIASLTAGSTTFSDGAALQELTIGAAGEALVVNGGATAPEWGSPAANVTVVSDLLASTFTTSSATATALTGLRITLPNIPGGKCLIVCSGTWARSTSGGANAQLYSDEPGSDQQIYGTMRSSEFEVDVVVPQFCYSSNCIQDANGQDISVYVWTGGGTLTCYGSGSSGNSWTLSAIAVA